jgi:hypothetical protein
MDKSKKEQVILIVLIPVFLVGLLYMRSQQSQKKPQPQVKTTRAKADLAADKTLQAIDKPRPSEEPVFTVSKTDPFKNLLQVHLYNMRKVRPKEKKIIPLPTVVIEGIVWNTHMPQAIINSKVVRIGDDIDGFEITGISKDGITIDYDGEQVLIERR